MRSALILVSAAALLAAPHTALAFESVWTDPFGETTYRISGPDLVGISETFVIVLTARDDAYPDEIVAAPWKIFADGEEHGGDTEIYLEGGQWRREFTFAYHTLGFHSYFFQAQDLGHGSGPDSWEWFAIGGLTFVAPPTGAHTSSWGAIRSLFR